METNITAWRRAVCGDLTAAFDFATPNTARVALPDTSAYEPADRERHPDYVPLPPTHQARPSQERGLPSARALPYELQVSGAADIANAAFRIDFANTGQAGACFHVRSGNTSIGPWTYTVEAGKSLSDSWNVARGNQGRYDLSVYGPNGFLRTFRGTASPNAQAKLDIDCSYDTDDYKLVLQITNLGPVPCRVTIANAYDNDVIAHRLRPGQSFRKRLSLKASFGWYDHVVEVDTDQAFLRRLAGHVENGRDSASDPAIGDVGEEPHASDRRPSSARIQPHIG
jgi:phospholipase C